MIKETNITEKEAVNKIIAADNELNNLTQHLLNKKTPWDTSLYDILIPIDKTGAQDTIKLIKENLEKPVVQTTENSKTAYQDFLLASKVNLELAQKGHDVKVTCKNKNITIAVEKNVLRMSKLETELKSIANKIQDVTSVEIKITPKEADAVYIRYNFELPSRVLLVDDEKDFALTLNKRLQMREIGSAVAFSGEEALNIFKEEAPDVLILDLRMPGIDGMDVLRKVKQETPNVEVIVLTGKGSKEDKETAENFGAYAYLEKPVDMETLIITMKKAQEKVNLNKNRS
ncbi:response regulator receiver protein [Candidatus Magnetoovum chiemensis]|nr:response regulator receiver protein [Candidatus Magnetoovum chiemensis]